MVVTSDLFERAKTNELFPAGKKNETPID